MVPGNKVLAIFGFCGVDKFEDINECIQDVNFCIQEILSYVNDLADIAHNTVDAMIGDPNKNIGEAFLMVWKFPVECIDKSDHDFPKIIRSNQVSQIADLSIIAFAKLVINLNLCSSLDKYNENEALKEKIPNFKVSMGYGMNCKKIYKPIL